MDEITTDLACLQHTKEGGGENGEIVTLGASKQPQQTQQPTFTDVYQ